jgi:predicted RNA-binding protein YlxR (DUF448 family)
VEPQRTCIGCRATQGRAGLVRLAWRDGVGVVVDAEQRLGGRGCYLHPECVDTALRRRAVGRALKRVVDPQQAAEALSVLNGPIE